MITIDPKKKKNILSALCFSVTITIFLAGLWPFEFHPRNNVSWLNGENGIHFDRRGIAYSKESVYGPQGAIRPGNPVSIELVVRPMREPKYSMPRILTLYTGGNRQFFTLVQWKTDLYLRTSSQGNDLNSDYRDMVAKNVLLKNIPRFITVTSQNGISTIYIDGQMTMIKRNFPILPADFSASGKFVLGNSPTGNSPWTGDLLFLAAYDRELSEKEVSQHFQEWNARGSLKWLPEKTPTLLYQFDERTGTSSRNHSGDRYNIFIPTTYHVLKKTVLRPPQREKFNRSFIRDDIVNIFGFLPFGFFFALWFRNGGGLPSKFHMFLVATMGCAISLTIELLQVYLPSRTSSLTDVICNTFGTILGIYIFRWIILSLSLGKKT